MDGKEMLSKAIGNTIEKQTSPVNGESTPYADEMPADGTFTVPMGVLPEETAEGDIIQCEVVTTTEEGIVLKPVESRIKQAGVGNTDVKAAGPDNSSAVGDISTMKKQG